MSDKTNKKLRQTEYYNQQPLWDKLYDKSMNGGTFSNLMNYISHPNNIKLAYRNIKANPGSKTPGVDNKSVGDYKNLKEEDIVKMVQENLRWYKPNKVKRVYIPKPNGKTRPLGIPTFRDRLIQQCIKQILEPICEAKFYKDSYGFRPNRNTRHAISRTYHILQRAEMHYVVNVDIKSFFDYVDHNKLIKQMFNLGIQDKKLLSIIKEMLKAEIQNEGKPNKGTPQGGILSPLLSNIVLNELDWWIASQFEELPTDTTYSDNNVKLTNIKRGKRSKNLKPMYIVRYADDFKIFCNTNEDAQKVYIATQNWLHERLNLSISPEKSGVVNARKDYFDFLGFKIKLVTKGLVTRYNAHGVNAKPKIKWVVKSHIADSNLSKIRNEYQTRVKGIKKSSNRVLSLNRLNFYIFQTHRYYEMATHVVKDFHKIEYDTLHLTNHRLGDLRSKKGVMAEAYKELYKNSKRVKYYSGIAVLPIGYVQHVSPKQFSLGITPFTKEGRIKIHDNLRMEIKGGINYMLRNPIPNRSIEYNDNRISKYSAQKGRDGIFGFYINPSSIHCHHIKPLSQDGDDNFLNLLILDEESHRLIHSTEIDTINRLFEIIKEKMMFEDKKVKYENIDKLNKYRLLVGNLELICKEVSLRYQNRVETVLELELQTSLNL